MSNSFEGQSPDLGRGPNIYTVSRLNSEVRWLLEDHFPQLWVEGEISNLARPRSGHIYFTLKDAGAQVRCAMFRMRNRQLDFAPDNGAHVLLRGRVSLYRERGDFQLIGDYIELAGAGALRRQFEQRRAKLDAEGLFRAEHKQRLPHYPNQVGIITSPSGAAVHDVIKVLQRRFPALGIIIYPTRVQGEGAADEIARTLRLADQRAECDVLLLVRGGGSLEDLWAFNEEVTARAIFACTTPVVAGVGHQTDVTIADFVADVAAPTPSAAAELVSPNRTELDEQLRRMHARLARRARSTLTTATRELQLTYRRLRHPRQHLEQLAQRTDDRLDRLARALENIFPHHHLRLAELDARLGRVGPASAISNYQSHCRALRVTLVTQLQRRLTDRLTALAGLDRALHTVSPQRTLERGYAVVTRADESREILRDAHAAAPGTRVQARLAQGALICAVEEVQER